VKKNKFRFRLYFIILQNGKKYPLRETDTAEKSEDTFTLQELWAVLKTKTVSVAVVAQLCIYF